MKHRVLVAIATLALVGTTATGVVLAHSPLKDSVPRNGAVVAVAAAPKKLELHFAHALRLTSVSLRGGKAPVALKPLPKAAIAHQLPLPTLAPGDYVAEWRGMAADGHVMSGSVRFKVAGR